MARAYIGMAGSYLMKHEYAEAVHWAQRGLERQQQVIRLTQHPVWGIVVKADAHLYEGEGVVAHIPCCRTNRPDRR